MKKLKIDKEKCIGCGLCASIAEKVFRLNNEGKAEIIDPPTPEASARQGELGRKAQEAIDSCPVSAISFQE